MASLVGCGRAPAPGASPRPSVSPASPETGPSPLPDPLPNIAGTVNGQPIGIRLVSLYIQKTRPKQVLSVAERAEVYRDALERCIDRELLFQDAVNRGLRPTDAEVQGAYDQARVKYPKDQDWVRSLETQHLSVEGFKMEIRTEKTVTLLLQQIAAGIPPVTDAEARAYYDQNPAVFETGEMIRARLIVIDNPLMGPAARATMREKLLPVFVHQLKSGVSFVTVAQRANTGGTWETAGQPVVLRRADLPENVANAAFSLKPGEMTDFIDTTHGFELVKVEERLPSEKLTYEQASPRLKKLLTEKRQTEALQKVVDALKAKARIERFL
jgi:peptidyl-prolyl cis-trans isomerase C